MKASFTSRITCSVLAATLAALPCNEALAAPAPAPTSASPPASAPPATGTAPATGTTTAPATGTAPTTGTTTSPTTGTAPTTGTPPTEDTSRGVDGTGAVTAPGETPTEVPGETPPPTEETPPPPEPEVVAPPPPPPLPEGPERPPEPTVANGKYKAKGNGLMIAGGTLLGLGLAGVITSALLTRCNELEDSFGCKNKQHNTFAVPATATAALLGAVLLFVGVGYKIRYKKWQNWKPETAKKTALYPTLIRGGAGIGYTLKF